MIETKDDEAARRKKLWFAFGTTQVILKNTPIRKMLEDLRDVWQEPERPKFSFPRMIEMLCYLAIDRPPTERELQKAYDQLKSPSIGRPKGDHVDGVYKSNSLVRCKNCSKEVEITDAVVVSTPYGKKMACSKNCETQIESEYGEEW